MQNLRNTIVTLTLVSLTFATSAFSAVRQKAKAVAAINVITETSGSTTMSDSYTDVPGALLTFSVPAGKKQLVQLRFSAESYCFGFSGDAYSWCSMRALVDGNEMLPNSGIDFAFDANGQTDDAWEGNSMERTLIVGPGTHTVRLQYAVTNTNVAFTVDDWTLTITQYNK